MSNQPEEVQTEALKARQRDQVRRLYQWARALLLCKIELTPDFILAQLAFMDVENPEAILLIAIQYANQHANAARWRCRGDYDTQDDIDWDALETCAQEAASAFMEACAAIQAEQTSTA